MLSYIKGKIVQSGENLLVVESNGLGYAFFVSDYAIRQLAANSDEVIVPCYMSVREDGISLFGFASNEEKELFLKLISVNGIGPKVAISILSGLDVNQLVSTIVSADVKKLSSIKGIGKKTAERIVLELREQVSKEYVSGGNDISGDNLAIDLTGPNSIDNEAVSALMSLGFTEREATEAVSRVQKDGMAVEELVFAALKNA